MTKRENEGRTRIKNKEGKIRKETEKNKHTQKKKATKRGGKRNEYMKEEE